MCENAVYVWTEPVTVYIFIRFTDTCGRGLIRPLSKETSTAIKSRFYFEPNPTPHAMPKWRCRTVRNVERIELLAKVLEENKLSLFSNVLPHVAVVTSQTPYRQLTCPHHVIQLNTAAYSPQWGPIASTSSGKDRTWNKISYNLILEGLLNITLIIL